MSEPSGLLRSKGFRVNSWKMKKRRVVRQCTEKTEKKSNAFVLVWALPNLFFLLNRFTAALRWIKRQFCSQTHFFLFYSPPTSTILNSRFSMNSQGWQGWELRSPCLTFTYQPSQQTHSVSITTLWCSYTVMFHIFAVDFQISSKTRLCCRHWQ